MNLYRDIGIAARAWVFAVRGIGRETTLEPFLLIGLAQAILLAGLVWFYLPALAQILEPVVRGIGGEEATHYPHHLWTLPETWRTTNLILLLTVTVIMRAVATARYANAPAIWSAAFGRAPALILIAIAGPGVAWGITTAFNQIPTEISLSSFVIRIGLQGLELGMIVIVESLVGYAIAFVMLDGAGPLRAIGASVGLALRHPLPTLLILAVPAVILFPPTFFLVEMDVAQSGLSPEGVALAWTLRLIVEWALLILVTGGLTGIYLHHPRRAQ